MWWCWSLLVLVVVAVDREMTIEVAAGAQECFFEPVEQDHTLTVDWEVVDGGHGDYSLNFRVVHPNGQPLVAEFKKPDGTFSQKIQTPGDYKICFDNHFSFVSSKMVYFEVSTENEDVDDYVADPIDIYETKVSEKLKKIKGDIAKARHMQDLIRLTDLKDRSIMEHNFESVNFMSSAYLILMVAAGFLQVFLMRSLFDEKSKMHGVWKKALKD